MTPYFKAHSLNFHIKKTKLEKKFFLLHKLISLGEKWGKLLKLGPECVKPVILFPLTVKLSRMKLQSLNFWIWYWIKFLCAIYQKVGFISSLPVAWFVKDGLICSQCRFSLLFSVVIGLDKPYNDQFTV